MVPQNRYYKLKPEYTRPHPYPVALVEGQYTSVYKRYTPEELNKFPIKTVRENDELFPVIRRERSPSHIVVTEAELQRRIDADRGKTLLHRQVCVIKILLLFFIESCYRLQQFMNQALLEHPNPFHLVDNQLFVFNKFLFHCRKFFSYLALLLFMYS